MKLNLISKFYRVFSVAAAFALMAVSLPKPVQAAAVPTITIKAVKVDESVTIQATNLPKNTEFTARMDVIGNYAIGGTVVGKTSSGSGSFEATYAVPSGLKGQKQIAIRIDSSSGFFSYNWFDNKTAGSTPSTQPPTGGKPYIEIVGVEKDKAVTLQGFRFPANQDFQIRVGPFKTFFRDYVVTGSVNSGSTGSFTFTVNLPNVVKGVEMVTVRLDSKSGAYAYNAFKNVSSGSVTPGTGNSTDPSGKCVVTLTSPGKSLKTREDFDAVWTVKNTSGKDWDLQSVDYKFVSGTSMHKKAAYDLKQTIKNGESGTIIVDMLAPDQVGSYTAKWAVVNTSGTLCSLSVTVTVK